MENEKVEEKRDRANAQTPAAEGTVGKNGHFYSKERLDKLKAARDAASEARKKKGTVTRLTKQAKKVSTEKDYEEKTEKAKKVLEENLPPKPEKTLENIEKVDVWREYYKKKYKSKKAKLTAKQAPVPATIPKENPAHEIAKQELKEYVNTEAMRMAMKSIFSVQ